MNRESLIRRLLWLRELRLREEVAQLKSQSAVLARVELTRDRARDAAASETIEELRDRSVMGEVRLQSNHAAREAAAQLALAARQVDETRRLTEAARDARAGLQLARRERLERVQEASNEEFQNWKRAERVTK